VTSIKMVSWMLVKSTLVSKLSKMNGESPCVLMLNQSSVNVHTKMTPVMDLGIVKKSSTLFKNS
jgi:hypothetical protein